MNRINEISFAAAVATIKNFNIKTILVVLKFVVTGLCVPEKNQQKKNIVKKPVKSTMTSN